MEEKMSTFDDVYAFVQILEKEGIRLDNEYKIMKDFFWEGDL